jgi:FkbM family methyltransferase
MAESAGDWRALLIDADPRAEASTKRTLTKNSLLLRCEYRSGLISKETGELDFALRVGAASSADTNMSFGEIQSLQRVRAIPPAEILAALPPPYDLIKIDVEGAEADFVEAYRTVYAHAAAIIMEWHSPDREGSNEKGLRELLEASNFSLVGELRPRRELQLNGGWISTGVQLYRRAPI